MQLDVFFKNHIPSSQVPVDHSNFKFLKYFEWFDCPRILGWLNWPFFDWNSCLKNTAFALLCICYMCCSSNFTLLLLRGWAEFVQKHPLHWLQSVACEHALGGGGRKGGLAPQELARRLAARRTLHAALTTDRRNSCIWSTKGTVRARGNGWLKQGVSDCYWLLMPEPLSTFFIFSHISLFHTHFYTLKINKI